MTMVDMRRSALKVMALCAAVLAFTLSIAGGAQAEQRNFCSGANVAPYMGSCASGIWRMNLAYANSMNGPVCIGINHSWGGIQCNGGANQGVYLQATACASGRAVVYNPGQAWIKAYGSFWTC